MSSDGFAGASATNLIEMLFEVEVVTYVVTEYSILFFNFLILKIEIKDD